MIYYVATSALAGMLHLYLAVRLENRPTGYTELNERPIELEFSKKGLGYLGKFTLLCSLCNILGYVPDLPQSYLPIIPMVSWGLLALSSLRINDLHNIHMHSSHYFAFLGVFLLFAPAGLSIQIVDMNDIYQLPNISHFIQIFLNLVLFLCLLFWSIRRQDDPLSPENGYFLIEIGCSIYSRLSFSFLNPLVKLGNKRPLESTDLYELIDVDNAKEIGKTYRKTRDVKKSIGYRIILASLSGVLGQLFCSLGLTLLKYVQPIFLFLIVNALESGTGNNQEVIIYLFGLLFFVVLHSAVEGQTYYLGQRIGARSRTILIDEIYQKTLHRTQGVSSSLDEDEKATVGKVVTLMSVDVDRLRWFFFSFSRPVLELPLSILVSVGCLFFVIGWSTFAGIAVLLLLIPLSSWLSVLLIHYEEFTMKLTDSRVSAINEMLQSIRIIKYFAWEEYFTKKINEKRAAELNAIFKQSLIWISFGIIGPGTSIIISFVTFFVYTVVLGNNLTAATAFTVIKLLSELKVCST
jgi:hypothetical protein